MAVGFDKAKRRDHAIAVAEPEQFLDFVAVLADDAAVVAAQKFGGLLAVVTDVFLFNSHLGNPDGFFAAGLIVVIDQPADIAKGPVWIRPIGFGALAVGVKGDNVGGQFAAGRFDDRRQPARVAGTQATGNNHRFGISRFDCIAGAAQHLAKNFFPQAGVITCANIFAVVIRLIPNLISRVKRSQRLGNLAGALSEVGDVVIPIIRKGGLAGVGVVGQDDQGANAGIAIAFRLLAVKINSGRINLFPAATVVKGIADHFHAEVAQLCRVGVAGGIVGVNVETVHRWSSLFCFLKLKISPVYYEWVQCVNHLRPNRQPHSIHLKFQDKAKAAPSDFALGVRVAPHAAS